MAASSQIYTVPTHSSADIMVLHTTETRRHEPVTIMRSGNPMSEGSETWSSSVSAIVELASIEDVNDPRLIPVPSTKLLAIGVKDHIRTTYYDIRTPETTQRFVNSGLLLPQNFNLGALLESGDPKVLSRKTAQPRIRFSTSDHVKTSLAVAVGLDAIETLAARYKMRGEKDDPMGQLCTKAIARIRLQYDRMRSK